jgi:hypothetical protein
VKTYGQRRSDLQEDRVARDLEGRRQKASGASKFAKGDVRKPLEIRAECKTTGFRSYSLKLSDWRKLQAQAVQGGLEAPVMQVEFQGQGGQNVKLAVIDWSYYQELRRNAAILEDAKRNSEEPVLFEDGVEDPL